MARVLLGVSGSITAYKGAALIRELQRQGHEVRCILTAGGRRFITPLTLQALSGHPVAEDAWHPTEPDGLDHIHLARWAEVLLIAPASADIIARLAAGLADDLLTATALAFAGPVFVAPSMNAEMYRHPATRANLDTLLGRGGRIIDGEPGELACGESGPGRMAEPDVIAARISADLRSGLDYTGLRVLVTAGPTVEALDPVRLITNRSSGRMGFAIAAALRERGAAVTLIHGPVVLEPPGDLDACIGVESTAEMAAAMDEHFPDCDLLIMAAAVADFAPAERSGVKLARSGGAFTLELRPTPDLLAGLTARKGARVVVGFALEIGDPVAGGRIKLEGKGLDAIAVNDPTEPGAGPHAPTNHLTLLFADGRVEELGPAPKDRVAHDLLDAIHPLVTGGRRE